MNQGLLESLMLEAFQNTSVSVHDRNFDPTDADDFATNIAKNVFMMTNAQLAEVPVTLFRRYFSDERTFCHDSFTGEYLLFHKPGVIIAPAEKDISAVLSSNEYYEVFSIQLGSKEHGDDINFAFVNFTYNQEPGAFFVDTASDADLGDKKFTVRPDDLTNAQLFLRSFQKYSARPLNENKPQIISDIRTLIKKLK